MGEGKAIIHIKPGRQEKQLKHTKQAKNIVHGVRCKNGWHRSVATTELLAAAFRSDGYHVVVEHTQDMCGCPRNCSNMHDKTDWTPEKISFMTFAWAADGHAAHVMACRLYHACEVRVSYLLLGGMSS